MNLHYRHNNNCNASQQAQHIAEQSTQKKYFNHQFNNISNGNIVNNNHNHHKNRPYSFKFEHIIDSVFLSNNNGATHQYSNRLFLGNQASRSINLHFQKKYHSRNHRHNGSGGISIPDDLYQEMMSLQSQILNLLKYGHNNNANGNKNRKKIIDIHIVYLQKNLCLGILIYYEYNNKYNNNILNLFNKYFNVIEFIDNQCYKYWQCPNVKCQHQLNKIKNIKESIFFCEKCKFDFTFHHNPNNHYHISFNNSSKSTKTNALNNKRLRSCIKYRFLSFQHVNNNNVTTMNLFQEMSHQKFQQLTSTQHQKHENKEIEKEKNKKPSNISMDWTEELILNNLEKWFDHKPGTKIGLNDYNFDVGKKDKSEKQINNVRCRDSEGERHGVDHNCIACKPWLVFDEEYDEEYEINVHNKMNVNGKKSWLCSLCQKSIPIDIKTCICISYENKNKNKNKNKNNNKNKQENGNKNKDCLIVIKELAETLHSTISFNEIPQEFKTSSKPFEYEICFNGEIIAKGHGNSKRKAQRNGAQIALEYLSKQRGYERKINLLQRFGRIGHCEIDRNLYVEICRDISDDTNIYSVLPVSYTSSNNENIFEYVIINESPEIKAYKTRVCEISQLDEPSVLGCLDVCGPLKFSLVSGIFHKDVNNGRYGYNYNNRNQRNNKKKKKRKKRKRNNNNNKLGEHKSINTSMNTSMNTNTEHPQVIGGFQRNKNMYSHPSKYEYHEIYCDDNSPQLHKHSKRRRKKKEKEKEKEKKKNNKLDTDGVYICNECGKYYADNLNGKYLSDLYALSSKFSKWFCFDCIKKINEQNHNNHLNSFIESAVYTQRKHKDKINQPTPPMTPPSSDDENNQKNNNKFIIHHQQKEKEEEIDDISLFGPHTPSSPSLSDKKKIIKMENDENNNENNKNNENNENSENNELGDDDDDDSNGNSEDEILQKTIETVSIATQVNCYHDNIFADKAIQVIVGQNNINNNKRKSLHLKYKEKYLNNIRINSNDYNYIQQQQQQQHQRQQILYGNQPTYNMQNSWDAYYGQPHRNILFIHNPYSQSIHSLHPHHHQNSNSNSHRNRYEHHHYHSQQQTTNRQHTTTTINGYQTFQCSAYSNINHI